MGVQLNIKDAETITLLRRISARRGESVTATVRALARDEEARRDAEVSDRVRRLTAIADQAWARLTPEQRAVPFQESMDSIYGPDGLPEE